MVIWLVAAALFAFWFAATFLFGRGGFVHVVLLCAVAVALVQFVHDRVAARG